MASFDPTVQPTSDPNYMNFSRGTDNASLRPLADVPKLNARYFKPDYQADTSGAKLLTDIGNVGSTGLKLANAVVETNINDDVNKSVNAIRDSFGVAAASQNQDIAKATAAAGAEGTGTTLLPKDPNLPLPIQKLGTRIAGLQEMYKNGDLSNSNYYAKMDAAVRQIKAQYGAGWSDDIDNVVKEKLGVLPANALRQSLQNDVEKLAAKVQAQNDKWTNFERQNSDVISTVYGGMDKYRALRASGKLSTSGVENAVGDFNAKILQNKVEAQNLALAQTKNSITQQAKVENATVGAADIADRTYLNVVKNFGPDGDLNQVIDAIQSGKRQAPGPEDKQVLQAHFQQLQLQTENALDRYFNEPLFDHGTQTTRAAQINDPSKIAQIKQMVMSKVNNLQGVIFGDVHPSIMKMDADMAQARQDATTNSVLRQGQSLLVGSVYKDKLGPNMISDLYMKSPNFASTINAGLDTLNVAQIANGGWSVQKSLSDARKEGVNDPQLTLSMIDKTKHIIQNPKQLADPTVQNNAIEHLFGKDNYGMTQQVLAGSGVQAATGFFAHVTDPKTVESIAKTDAAHKQMFTDWATQEWPHVFNSETANANNYAQQYSKYKGLDLKFDPKAGRFYYEGDNARAPEAMSTFPQPAQFIVQTANGKLSGLNTAIQSMKRVWDMNGETDTAAKLRSWLPTTGLAPNSPIYKAIEDEIKQEQEPAQAKAG